ncbi:MAG TPA: ATP-binding cassette domain-containing protein [Thermoanaerobaculia bacterium]|nr:ATP-binding cassette domain-containing protein [Thermoanaerobaculia bacterium]
MTIELRNVVLPLAHFTLAVDVQMPARTTGIFGPSGAGKTSLLELIAGLRTPKAGRVVIDGRDVTDLPPRDRRIGYVPQDDALFPHLSVKQNVLYGAHNADDAVLDVLEIRHLLPRGVNQLSGGERKRVALARALLSHPDVLLLDEPLAGVDVELRNRVLQYLVRIRDEFPIPMLYVSHDIEEVRAICEAVVRIERGRAGVG